MADLPAKRTSGDEDVPEAKRAKAEDDAGEPSDDLKNQKKPYYRKPVVAPTEPMPLADLIPTQHGVRFPSRLPAMIDFVRGGGVFNEASHEAHEASKAEAQRTESEAAVDESAFAQDGFRRLLLIEYEDGRLFVHDGHHRVMAVFLSGVRDHLKAAEYIIHHHTYASCNIPITSKTFVTPYDPRVESRLPDFGTYKTEAMAACNESEENGLAFIANNRHRYCLPREHSDLVDLARYLGYHDEAAAFGGNDGSQDDGTQVAATSTTGTAATETAEAPAP